MGKMFICGETYGGGQASFNIYPEGDVEEYNKMRERYFEIKKTQIGEKNAETLAKLVEERNTLNTALTEIRGRGPFEMQNYNVPGLDLTFQKAYTEEEINAHMK